MSARADGYCRGARWQDRARGNVERAQMEYRHILWERQGGVGIVTLNRPAALNALNRPHLIELNHAVQRAEFDPGVRSLIITGAGRGFSAGADVKEWGAGGESEEPAAGWIDLAHALIARLYRLPKPVVAAVNGVAVGAGCDIALAADLRVASTALLPARGRRRRCVGEGGYGRRARTGLVAHGYAGPIYPVNPHYDTAAGLPAYPTLAALPGPVDAIVIAVPARAVPGYSGRRSPPG